MSTRRARVDWTAWAAVLAVMTLTVFLVPWLISISLLLAFTVATVLAVTLTWAAFRGLGGLR